MTFLNIGKYLLLTLGILPCISFKYTYSAEKNSIKCDPSEELPYIANLDIWERQAVKPGEKLKYSCLPGYGFTLNDKIYSTFEIICGANGKFTGFQGISCQKACSVADAIKLSNNVSSNATIMIQGKETPIASSQLVNIGDTIKITCLPDYFLIGDHGNITDETSYYYTCSNTTDSSSAIRKCKIPPVVFKSIKPISNFNGTIMNQCDLVSLEGIANAKITAADNNGKSPTLPPSKEATLTCIKNFSAIYKGKISEKFKVTCDPRGTGRFVIYNSSATTEESKYAPLIACTQRCNIDELAKKSSMGKGKNVNTDSTPTVEFLNPENNQNAGQDLSQFRYANINEKVRVNCPDGYAIRSTNQVSYESVCLASGFDKIEICEPEIKPCDNAEIIIGDSVVYSPRGTAVVTPNGVSGKTWVGLEVDLACQGGNSFYFEKASGQSNLPRCIIANGISQWDKKNFNCFNGCITPDNSIKLATGKSKVTIVNMGKKLFSRCNAKWVDLDSVVGDWHIGPACSPPSDYNVKYYFDHIDVPLTPAEEYEAYYGGRGADSYNTTNFHWLNSPVISGTSYTATYDMTRNETNFYNTINRQGGEAIVMLTGFSIRQQIDVERCNSRQTSLVKKSLTADQLIYSSILHSNPASYSTVNFMFYGVTDAGNCKGTLQGQNNEACQGNIESHYNISFASHDKPAISSPIVKTNVSLGSGSCAEILSSMKNENLLKVATFNNGNCKGSGAVEKCGWFCNCGNMLTADGRIRAKKPYVIKCKESDGSSKTLEISLN